MKSPRPLAATGVLTLVVLLGPAAGAEEPTYEVGVGLGFADGSSAGFDGGWDLMFGVEWRERQTWYIGSQLHILNGWTSGEDVDDEDDLAFDSVALNFTFRPKKPAADWIQLRTGVVHADLVRLTESERGLGWAVGAGAMLHSKQKLRLHLFDFSHYRVGGESFNVYSISFAWFGIFAGH